MSNVIEIFENFGLFREMCEWLSLGDVKNIVMTCRRLGSLFLQGSQYWKVAKIRLNRQLVPQVTQRYQHWQHQFRHKQQTIFSFVQKKTKTEKIFREQQVTSMVNQDKDYTIVDFKKWHQSIYLLHYKYGFCRTLDTKYVESQAMCNLQKTLMENPDYFPFSLFTANSAPKNLPQFPLLNPLSLPVESEEELNFLKNIGFDVKNPTKGCKIDGQPPNVTRFK